MLEAAKWASVRTTLFVPHPFSFAHSIDITFDWPEHLWGKDEYPIAITDKDALKLQLVHAMIALSGVSDKAICTQIAESVSSIAELDFPEQWPDLIDVRQRMNLTVFTHVLSATRTTTH